MLVAGQMIVAAAHAHSNLNIFAAVVSILEGGHIYGPGAGSANMTAAMIIELCKAEQARQLDAYDRACRD
jgi:hypothetical protein